ncbi:MAG: sigma-70 family RNA polymerase sigma factor [Gammaproteobacteria bacterium]
MRHEKDLNLVARMLAGEQRAFDEFFRTYASRLAAFAARRSRLNAAAIEDIVQNSLIKAMRNIASFRGEAALFTWLCEICRCELADVYRKAARQPTHESLDAGPFTRDVVLELRAAAELEPCSELEMADRRGAIATALNGLPERYARALEWKYGDGFSVQEISQMLGVTPTAAQSLLARAREAFKEFWHEETAL